MNCPSCGFENPDAAKFCGDCARPLARTTACPSCGVENPTGQKFCNECAHPLPAASKATAQDRSPREYTPRHLADKILQSKSALEGERKQVTVLFADVKGSLELAEQVDPEEWHRILDRFFQILANGVHRFEGTVNQYTGDGIMALFGAPIAHEDHAQRACFAALHLTDEVRRYARELRLERGLNFSVRMGLNSGEVVIGKIGDDLRMDYTAQGHTVGLAARMEQLAEPGKVYLAEGAAKIVTGYFELEDLGELRIPGVRETLRVFELQGLGKLRTRLDVSRARGFSKFVGRTDEMASLEAALERASAGRGQVIGVVGEAGVGKSRLCYEFTERCRGRGIPIRRAHGVAHGKMVPFLPVVELLRDYFEITDSDSPEVARNKVAGALLLLEREFENALPFMFDLLGVPDPEKRGPTLEPEEQRRRLLGVVRRLLEARSAREPGVILIEDLHWIDSGTEAFLEGAVDASSRTRTLLLVNFRPEYHASWMQKSYYQQVPLLPLGPGAIGELLHDLLGDDPSLAGLSELVRERTGGNPFFIEEVVQSLVESGGLEGARGGYRLVEPIERLAIPGTVQSVLAARIDRLGEREKHVLQAASVVGKSFPESILRQVVELPEKELTDALHGLMASEFLYEAALYPETEYTFKHPLTQQVAYASQIGDRRARLHAAVAGALERQEPEKLDERAGLLGHHWEGAGEPLKAARWHRRAGEWAGMRHPLESFQHWLRVQELADTLPESPERDELGALARAWMLTMAGRIGAPAEEMERLFREGSDLARQSGNDHALAQLISAYGSYRHITEGTVDEVLEDLVEAVRLTDGTEDAGLQFVARYHLCGIYLFTQPERGLEVCNEALEMGAEAIDLPIDRRMGGVLHFLKVSLLLLLGRPEEAAPISDVLARRARESGDVVDETFVHWTAATLAYSAGEGSKAVAHAREAADLAERWGTGTARAFTYGVLGEAHNVNGEWDRAVAAFEQAAKLHREQYFRQFEPMNLARLALAYLGRGERERGRATADEAIRIASRTGNRFSEILGQIALAQILTYSEDENAAAETALARADELIDRTGIRSLSPSVLEVRAERASLCGDGAERERLLREAQRLYIEMDATGHAERLARELGS